MQLIGTSVAVQRVGREVPQLHHPGLVLEVADRHVVERGRTAIHLDGGGNVTEALLPPDTVRVDGPLVTRFFHLGRKGKRP